ncbi:MAG: YopX family protein [Patescibacteria group bacterium]
MSREIKFRAWNISEKKMYYQGQTVGYRDDGIGAVMSKLVTSFFSWKMMGTLGALTADFSDNLGPNECCMAATMNGDIMEQFTGLKDRLGKDIYEGDIVKETFTGMSIISWDVGNCQYRMTGLNNECNGFLNMAMVLEVIGNIHENGDLLGKK